MVVKRLAWWISYGVPVAGIFLLTWMIVSRGVSDSEWHQPVIRLLILGVMTFTIRQFWRISLHTTTMASIWMILVWLYGWENYWWFILLVAVVMWSRVELQKHTPAQVIAALLLTLSIFTAP